MPHDIRRSGVLENEERNAEFKVPFAGFVAEGKHGEVDPEATADGGHEKDDPLGCAFSIAALNRFPFIITHNEECDDVDSCQDCENDVLGSHVSSIRQRSDTVARCIQT